MMTEELYQKIRSLDIAEMDNFLVIIHNKGVKAMAEFIEDKISSVNQTGWDK